MNEQQARTLRTLLVEVATASPEVNKAQTAREVQALKAALQAFGVEVTAQEAEAFLLTTY